ncbi:MAG: methylenetetrahydrofolate reductase [Chloroflexi bacterium]|nr:methylenetetrahydrofolate reductase [Chloroflexota bacterium]
MANIIDYLATEPNGIVTMCDFSTPRGADFQVLEQTRSLSADFICVAYSPGRSVRVDSAMTSAAIKQRVGKDVVFTLACRDMNKLAIQNHLLGAQVLGLENVVVVRGDQFTDKDLTLLKEVHDYRTTDLLRAIGAMNQGVDFRGLKLKVPTSLCPGATIDPAKGVEREAQLAYAKVRAGAQFLVTQALYDPALVSQFQDAYATLTSGTAPPPSFVGLAVLRQDGISFGDVPQRLLDDLAKGRPGFDIAMELFYSFRERGVRAFYVVPPILKGGVRDYEAAQRVLQAMLAEPPMRSGS